MKTKPRIEIDLKKVEALAERGLSQQQIADALGISERTLRSRKQESAEFAEAIKRGQAKGIGHVANKLMESVNAGNVTAAIFYLKAKAGWRDQPAEEFTASGAGFSFTVKRAKADA